MRKRTRTPAIAMALVATLALSATCYTVFASYDSQFTTQQLVTEVTNENSAELRQKAKEDALAINAVTQEDKIKQRLLGAWGDWQPDYEGWLNWANSLYTEDSVIYAFSGQEQAFSDYKQSMGGQRSAFNMEMGPIMQITVEDNVAALVYHMYLTPKDNPEYTVDMMVTEFNTFTEVDGKLMVSRLDLYTDGGGMMS